MTNVRTGGVSGPRNPKKVNRRKDNPYASVLARMKDRGTILASGSITTSSINNASVTINSDGVSIPNVPALGIPPPLGSKAWALRQGSSLLAISGGYVSWFKELYSWDTTWTKANYPNLKGVWVECIGGGGAGGGAGATAAGQSSSGQGGGGGAWGIVWIRASLLGTTEAIDVGAGGTGVSGANGGNGAATSFGSHITAGGGQGGNYDPASSNDGPRRGGGAGGTPSGGDWGYAGGEGFPGLSVGGIGVGGAGAAAPVYSSVIQQPAPNSDGVDNPTAGGGGSGGNNSPSSGTARAGGDGGDGLIIIHYVY